MGMSISNRDNLECYGFLKIFLKNRIWLNSM